MGNHSAFSYNIVFDCLCFQKYEHTRRPIFSSNFDFGIILDYCSRVGDVCINLENETYVGKYPVHTYTMHNMFISSYVTKIYR